MSKRCDVVMLWCCDAMMWWACDHRDECDIMQFEMNGGCDACVCILISSCILRMCLNTAYLAETKNLLLKEL